MELGLGGRCTVIHSFTKNVNQYSQGPKADNYFRGVIDILIAEDLFALQTLDEIAGCWLRL
jgi:hypothetical protein